MTVHWPFGGSTADRTLNCPGWRRLADLSPKPDPSPYAEIGSALHECMEDILLGKEPHAFNPEHGVTVNGIEIDREKYLRILDAHEAFRELVDEYDIHEFEPEVGAEYAHEIGGHADFVAVSKDLKTVVVGDFKFGQGYQIMPEENPQAMFYAMVLRAASPVADMFQRTERIVLAIVQPNDRDLPVLRTWETTPERIEEFERQFMKAVERARAATEENPDVRVGAHCRFCPAAALCPARTGMAHRALLMDPADLDKLSEMMELLPRLRDWITSVEQTALQQLERGAPVPGYKLVSKRAVRRWSEPEEVIYKRLARKLGGKKVMTESKILSPAKMEKLAKAKGLDPEAVIEPLVVTQASGYSVAHEDDKRPAVLPASALSAALATLGKRAA